MVAIRLDLPWSLVNTRWVAMAEVVGGWFPKEGFTGKEWDAQLASTSLGRR